MFRRRVSLKLLRTNQPPAPAEVRIFEEVTEQLQLNNGVYRTTSPGRFAELDPQINALLHERYPTDRPLRIHDWAASAALTSAEWADSVLSTFPHATLTASDLVMFLIELELDDGSCFVLEPDGAPLQYIRGPFTVRLHPRESFVFAGNRFIGSRAMRKLHAMRDSVPFDAFSESTAESAEGSGWKLRKIALVHPAALALAGAEPRFSVMKHSAFEPLHERVDVIRTMNIYNRDYFDMRRLEHGIKAVFDSLIAGGLWLVGRTLDGVHSATMFSRNATGFEAIQQFGSGSEIATLVTDWHL